MDTARSKGIDLDDIALLVKLANKEIESKAKELTPITTPTFQLEETSFGERPKMVTFETRDLEKKKSALEILAENSPSLETDTNIPQTFGFDKILTPEEVLKQKIMNNQIQVECL